MGVQSTVNRINEGSNPFRSTAFEHWSNRDLTNKVIRVNNDNDSRLGSRTQSRRAISFDNRSVEPASLFSEPNPESSIQSRINTTSLLLSKIMRSISKVSSLWG